MSLKTPLSRARGLGSAKSGVKHFWLQRVSALGLIPLGVWFLASVVAYSGADYETAMDYLRKPHIAALCLLFIAAAFIHMRAGLQVVVEDYIHREGSKLALLVLVDFAVFGFGAIAAVSLLKIAVSH